MKLNFKKSKSFSVQTSISLLLLVILLGEVYFSYLYLYRNFRLKLEVGAPVNLVRVNLKSYQEIINLVSALQNYRLPAVQLKNSNPFK